MEEEEVRAPKPNDTGEPSNVDEEICESCRQKVPFKSATATNLNQHPQQYGHLFLDVQTVIKLVSLIKVKRTECVLLKVIMLR